MTAVPAQPVQETAVGRMLELLSSHADQVAVVAQGREWTFTDLIASVRSNAAHLADLGVGRGSVVAVLLGERAETFTLRWAGNVLGAAVLVVPDGLCVSSLAAVLRTCEATAVVVDETHRAVVEEAATDRSVTITTPVEPDYSAAPVVVLAQAEDVAAIRLTGGSTGVPKAIPRTAAVPPYLSPPALQAWAGTVQLLCTPIAHLAGTLAEVVLAAGGRVVIQPGFVAADVLVAIAQYGVTWVWMQPRHLHRLLDAAELAQADLSSLRSVSLGSAPNSPHRLAAAVEVLGPIITSGYGTQEANQVTWLGAEEHADPYLRTTVGRPVPGVELTIRGESGAELPQGETGEIWVRGPALVSGYLNAPAETEAAFDAEGWFHTGDLGRLDPEGYLSVVGRLKDVILAEHDRVYPLEVEETLLRHPHVAAAAVLGLRDNDGVETVGAVIVPRSGGELSGAELQAWVREHGKAAGSPAQVLFVEELPVTSSAKVDRGALENMFG